MQLCLSLLLVSGLLISIFDDGSLICDLDDFLVVMHLCPSCLHDIYNNNVKPGIINIAYYIIMYVCVNNMYRSVYV